MKIRLLLFLLASPALADRRIETRYYSPDRIISIAGHEGVQTMIEFGNDERIENIALGDSAAWQVTPNKRANLLFLKPLMTKARTNMTVVTDKRRYLFDLYNGRRLSRPLYSLRFVYPEDVKAAVALEAPPPAPLTPPPVLNNNWAAKGDAKLIPARIYDDGVSTFIAWADTNELPAIFAVGTDGGEGPVNFTVKGDYIVIDGVAPGYVVRLGKASATLTNGAPRAPKPISAPEATK